MYSKTSKRRRLKEKEAGVHLEEKLVKVKKQYRLKLNQKNMTMTRDIRGKTATTYLSMCLYKHIYPERALKRVDQQVSALLRGEDLPEGAEANEVVEVPDQIPAVPKEAT